MIRTKVNGREAMIVETRVDIALLLLQIHAGIFLLSQGFHWNKWNPRDPSNIAYPQVFHCV